MKFSSTLNISMPLNEVWNLFKDKSIDTKDVFMSDAIPFESIPSRSLQLLNRCNLLADVKGSEQLRKRLVMNWQTSEMYCKENLCFMNLGEHTRIICTLEFHFKSWVMQQLDVFYADKYYKLEQKCLNELKTRLEKGM